MGKQSIQKASFIKTENYTTKNGHPGTKLHYTWLKDDGTKKDVSVQWVNKYLNDDSKKILENLKAGSEMVVVKEEEGQYWNFKELKDSSTYQPKPVWDGNKGNNPAGKYQGSGKSNYDPYGATIGMMFNNAVLSSLKEKGKYDRDYTMQLAKSLVRDVQEFDSYARPILEQGKDQQSQEDKSKTESYNQDMTDDLIDPPF